MTLPKFRRRRYFQLISYAAGAVVLTGLNACETTEVVETPRTSSPSTTFALDVPEIMRGTVASKCYLVGYKDQDIVVHGYGLVVNLKGTGDRIISDQIRSHMIQEMARRGVGSPSEGFPMSPEAVLDSPDTAVVVVTGIVPHGAVEGETFDVRVEPVPGADTTSLEGGRLWTADLRPAQGPLPPVGSRQRSVIATASGDVFTNPFVAPNMGAEAEIATGTSVVADAGRVLGGGRMLRSMPLKLYLATPSHNDVSQLQQIINSYFPQEPGQRVKTARGEGDQSIEITVPPSYYGRSREFVHLLQHTSILSFPAPTLVAFVNRVLKASPSDAEHASWRWQAMGPTVLPGIREFYRYPEELPRFAALRAGARLHDAAVEPHLLELAHNASPAVRKDAIELLGEMPPHPNIIMGLKDLLDDKDPDVRIACYEALAKSSPYFIHSVNVDGGKFRIDYIDSETPMVYVTMANQPRVAVFGGEAAVKRPITLSTWGDRVWIRGDSADEKIEVAYREDDGSAPIYSISPDLREFVPFLGHTTTIEAPMAGLGLTYSETIGILASIYNARYLNADFRTEQDRIRLAMIEQRENPEMYEPRPELIDLIEETAPADDAAPEVDVPSNLVPPDDGLRDPFGDSRDLGDGR
jgi:hypothetical protein